MIPYQPTMPTKRDEPTWCCLCEDPFDPPMTPPVTFPIVPCTACHERSLREVELHTWSRRVWTCPHRKPQDPPCIYCDSLVSTANAQTERPSSLRTLSLRTVVAYKDVQELKSRFFSGHPIWGDVAAYERFCRFQRTYMV